MLGDTKSDPNWFSGDSHPDHKATHIIAKRAGKELNLNAEHMTLF